MRKLFMNILLLAINSSLSLIVGSSSSNIPSDEADKANRFKSFSHIQSDEDYAQILGIEEAQKKSEEDTMGSLIHSLNVARNNGFFIPLHQSTICRQSLNHKDIAKYSSVLTSITTEFTKNAQESNVHALDAPVAKNIMTLDAIGNELGLGNPSLTIEQMKNYLLKNSNFYNFYEKKKISITQFKDFINRALTTASSDKITLGMYSRVISILDRLGNEHVENITDLQNLFDGFCENYITNGGCLQGVRNRICLRYAALLNSIIQ